MTDNNLTARVKAFIESERLWNPGDKVLVAFSGGIDSMVLTHIFRSLHIPIELAHLDHGLRGEESEREVDFLKNWAVQEGLLLHVHREDVGAFSRDYKLSIEEGARILRYRWLEHVRSQTACRVIATAHHLHDNLETTLLHLVKGSGLKGLSGIPVRNGKVVRPLLFLTKDRIKAYATEKQLPYVEDSSNASTVFLRNRLRLEVIPKLKEINPSLEETFAINNRLIREGRILADIQLGKLAKKACSQQAGDLVISMPVVLHSPAPLSTLFHILSPHGFSRELCEQVLASAFTPGKLFESGAARLISDRKNWILTLHQDGGYSHQLIGPGTRKVSLPGHILEITLVPAHVADNGRERKDIAYFDAGKITFPLLVRPWKKGDYFYPSGLYKKGGQPARKKVSDLFTDVKLNRFDKEKSILLLSGEKVIWVAGIRQDERFKATPNSKDVLKIKMLPRKGSITY